MGQLLRLIFAGILGLVLFYVILFVLPMLQVMK